MAAVATDYEYEEEHRQVESWNPPSEETLQTKRRVFDLETWIERTGFVHERDVIEHAMKRFNVTETTAKRYLKMVIRDFEKAGVPVYKRLD